MRKTLLLAIYSVFIFCVLLSCEKNPTTIKEGEDGDTVTVSDIDGNTYRIIKIGNQWCTAENLRTTKYNDGKEIQHVSDSAAWANLYRPAYCYYNNTIDNDSIVKYGVLYNWHVISTGKLNPEGWHVPTDTEWTELGNYLISNGYNWDGTTSGNKIAKAMAAKTGWELSSSKGAIGNNLSTNNSSGFSAMPGGCRDHYGDFYHRGLASHWWSATDYLGSFAYLRNLYYEDSVLTGSINGNKNGYSVRLVKD
ncbi:MAG: hypothetical protein GY853_00920 [PVC group bacterium]|nr:hypothetical protein [PVC group bacterium]